ncbi:hypothetical protein [Methanobrevibacter sp. DSM 116169]|uniref:hypothetical protein n=1 Tax=Methanobrevibacter sp. DSM 116169 TaxID=3242727 RepID=UPI0038FD396F
MTEAGNMHLESADLGYELNEINSDLSEAGINKKVNLTKEIIATDEKMLSSLNDALANTENETIKEYLNLAINLTNIAIKEEKSALNMYEAQQKYNNKEITLDELTTIENKYKNDYKEYETNVKQAVDKIEEFLKDKTELKEELKSYGFGGGLFLGEWGTY